jgi:hypothetical protein
MKTSHKENKMLSNLYDALPNLPFDRDCPIEIQLLFTALLGAATGIVVSYIVAELVRILKE